MSQTTNEKMSNIPITRSSDMWYVVVVCYASSKIIRILLHCLAKYVHGIIVYNKSWGSFHVYSWAENVLVYKSCLKLYQKIEYALLS